MKKNKQPDGMPVWFDGKSINEALFCEEFLQTHKIIFPTERFFWMGGLWRENLKSSATASPWPTTLTLPNLSSG